MGVSIYLGRVLGMHDDASNRKGALRVHWARGTWVSKVILASHFADVWVMAGYHIEYLRISECNYSGVFSLPAKYPQQVMHTQISRSFLSSSVAQKKMHTPTWGVVVKSSAFLQPRKAVN